MIRGVLVGAGIAALGVKSLTRGYTTPGSVAIVAGIVVALGTIAWYRFLRARIPQPAGPMPGFATFYGVQVAVTLGFLIVIGATLLR